MKKEAISLVSKKARFCLRDSKNLALRQFGLLRVSTLILALTDRCNLKCAMCDIWEKERRDCCELDFNKIRQLFRLRALRPLKHISLTGGEPFLRNDLAEIVSEIKGIYPRLHITISSNGTLTGQITDFLQSTHRYRNIVLEFSLLGTKMHDDVSGVSGSFEKLENTIRKVRQNFPTVNLKLKFVITPWNYMFIENAAAYCLEHKIPLVLKIIENVKSYTNSVRYNENLKSNRFIFNPEQLKLVIAALRKIKHNRMVDRLCIEYLIKNLMGKEKNKPCFVPLISLFINAAGNIHSCRMFEPIGNIYNIPTDYFSSINKSTVNMMDFSQDVCGKCSLLLRYLI